MRNPARLAWLVVVVPVLLTACTTATTSRSTTARSSAATSPSGAASSVAIKPLTGTQLKAALVTDVPPKFTLDKSGTRDTGVHVQVQTYGSMKSRSHCADLGFTAWIETSGMTGVAFAQSDYVDGHIQEIAQEIDSYFTPADAAQAVSQLTAFMKQCKTFTTKSSTYHLALSSLPSLGDGAVKGVLTSPDVVGGVVEIAAAEGNNVITALYSATKLSTAQQITSIVAQIQQNLRAQS
jgi:hypothetical protein